MRDYLVQLEGCKLLEGIKAQDMPRLFGCLKARCQDFRRDQFLLRAGDSQDELGILLTGSVSVVREDYWGNRSLVQKLGPLDIFAESYALSGSAPLRVSVVAGEDSRVLWLDGPLMLERCQKNCEFHQRLLLNLTQSMAQKNLALSRKIELLALRSTKEKLLNYLSQEALLQGSDRFSITLSRQELADYLCVDRSAMCAMLSRLKREGALDYHRNHFRIPNRDGEL